MVLQRWDHTHPHGWIFLVGCHGKDQQYPGETVFRIRFAGVSFIQCIRTSRIHLFPGCSFPNTTITVPPLPPVQIGNTDQVFITGTNFDAPGDDRVSLNGGWVRISHMGEGIILLNGWTLQTGSGDLRKRDLDDFDTSIRSDVPAFKVITQLEKHTHAETHKTCKVCSSSYSPEKNPSHFSVCERCASKILIVLLVIMVITSYVAWFM